MLSVAEAHQLLIASHQPLAEIAAAAGLTVNALEKRLKREHGARSHELRTGKRGTAGRPATGRAPWQVRLTVAERAVVDAALVAGRAAGAKSDGEALAKVLQRLSVALPSAAPSEAVLEVEVPSPPLRRKQPRPQRFRPLPGDSASEAAQKEQFTQKQRRFAQQAPAPVTPAEADETPVEVSPAAVSSSPIPADPPPMPEVADVSPPPDWALDEARVNLKIADNDTWSRISGRGGFRSRIAHPEVEQLVAAAEVWLRASGGL